MKLNAAVLASIAALLAARAAAAPVEQVPGSGPSEAALKEAQNAMKAFKTDPGMKVELFAAEPLLANPVAFYPDEKGRWFIAESYRQEKGVEDNRAHGDWLNEDIASRTVESRLAMMKKFYSDEKKFAEKFTRFEERITRVEDSDGDGVADRSTVFADGFRDPLDGTGAGLLVRGNDLWWTCIPHLWRFEDKERDGKADAREKLLSGFGVKFAFRGHDMHGLRFGPEGKLYFSIGDRGLNVTSKEGKKLECSETGAILRCNLDGTAFEIFATGLRNPQELAFNEFGDLFTGDNNSDSGDKARFVHLVEGGDSGWRTSYQYLGDRGPWNRELLWDEKEARRARYIVPPIANVANGPSGLTYNPGTGLGERHKGRFFLSDFRGGASASVVHQIALQPAGASYKMKERHEFVTGVLTTDCEFGPDGSLYVLDWVESWGGVGKGRIYKFTEPTRNIALQAETQNLVAEGMAARGEAELVNLLGHPDMRVRQAAQFELAAKGSAAAKALGKAASAGPNRLARLHAIWGLGQIAGKDPQALLPVQLLLQDPDSEVRAQAAKVAGDHPPGSAAEKLVALLSDKERRVRYFAALSLGKLRFKPAFEPLCTLLLENNDQDPVLRHGAVMGLAGVATPAQLAAKANDPSVAVRAAAVVALRRQKSPQIAAFLRDRDESVVLETARAIHDVPIVEALPGLAELLGNKALKSARILERAINAHFRLGKADNARALVAYALERPAPEASRRDALAALAAWRKPDPKDRLLNQWRPLTDRPGTDAIAAVSPVLPALLKDPRPGIQEMTARLTGKLSITAAGEPLAELAMNDKAAAGARIAAIQALGSLKDSRLAEVAKAGIKARDPKVRSEALKALAGLDPAAAVKMIAEIIESGTQIEKQGAVIALGEMKRPEAKEQLAALMDKLVAGEAPAAIQLEIFEAAKKADLKDRLASYRASLPAADELARFKISLAGGDVERGRKIFREKAEVQCLRCHKCEIGDSLVGPDLTRIGAQRDRSYLLESIVYPNKTTAPGFQIVTLTLQDGNVVAGRLLSEKADSLSVESMDAAGKPKTLTVAVANVKERLSGLSPMPETIRDQLSLSELRDVVEYLATRK